MKPRDEVEYVAPDQAVPVELAGGPLCGRSVNWPQSKDQLEAAYYGGTAIYQYEGAGKAVHLKG